MLLPFHDDLSIDDAVEPHGGEAGSRKCDDHPEHRSQRNRRDVARQHDTDESKRQSEHRMRQPHQVYVAQ